MDDLLKKEILDSIHTALRLNNLRFTEEQLEKADQEILPFIEENIHLERKPSRVVEPLPSLLHEREIYPAIVRYYAILQDNVELLKVLNERRFPFYEEKLRFRFFALNKELSSKFQLREYLYLLDHYRDSIELYMRGLTLSPKEDHTENLRTFAELVHLDPSLLRYDEKGDAYTTPLLTKSNIETYGKEFLLQSTAHQRKILRHILFAPNAEEAKKIKELITRYPQWKGYLPLSREALQCFSVDELGKMRGDHALLYGEAIRVGVLPRMKVLLARNPEFTCPKSFIRGEIFKVLDNDTILRLTEEGKKEISELRIPEIENVTVFPFRKINRLVFYDKIRQKTQKAEEKNKRL